MEALPLDSPTQVLQCGGVVTYQLLCGRDLARSDAAAAKSANYCYLIVNTHDRTAVALDAAWDVDGIYALAVELDVKVRGCIYSHYHFDHCGGDPGIGQAIAGRRYVSGAREVQERGGQIWAGRGDVERIQRQCKVGGVAALDDGDVLDCGDLLLHVIHTPGHSPGSICIFAAPQCLSPRGKLAGSPFRRESAVEAEGGLLLTGDTLFVGACGRTDFGEAAGMDPQKMMSSLSRLSKMDPSVFVLPGHNYAPLPFTTIGRERASNASMQHSAATIPRPPPLPPCAACGEGGACGPRRFVVGRRVRVKGLLSDAGRALNGQDGAVEGFSEEKGRYLVRLLANSEAKVIKPGNLERYLPDYGAPCGPSRLIIGRRVRIVGLHSDAGSILNGQDAVVERFLQEKGRYAVRIDSNGEMKVINPQNLESLDDEARPEKDLDTSPLSSPPASAQPSQGLPQRNLALGRPATASSSKSAERDAGNAVDGSPDTRWTSAYADGQWLCVDLGDRHAIFSVKIRWERAHARSYLVQGSSDGIDWETLASESGREGWVITSLPGDAEVRWVRMYGEQRATEYGFSIWELKVFA